MPGVWTWNFGDDFAHLYLDSIATNHNADGRGYETFGNGTAETLLQESPADEVSREWYRPLPPPPTPFRWSMRDNLNYTETAALVALDAAAQQSHALLRNFYLKALHSWHKGLEQAPYAFMIPADQGDPMRVAQLVARLMSSGYRGAARKFGPDAGRGRLPGGDLRGADGPALSQLRNGSADAAALSGRCPRALRRCLLGAAGALSPGRDRRPRMRTCAMPT